MLFAVTEHSTKFLVWNKSFGFEIELVFSLVYCKKLIMHCYPVASQTCHGLRVSNEHIDNIREHIINEDQG